MARWDPGADLRLQNAALDLYEERGYDDVTVEQIADRAGLTRRSFFRYYADRREVLFAGSERLPPALVEAVGAVPREVPPFRAVVEAMRTVGGALIGQLDVDRARRRHRVIVASPELREREHSKFAAVTEAVAGALRGRGVDPGSALLLAEVATVAFRTAFERCVTAGTTFSSECDEVVRDLAAALLGVARDEDRRGSP